MLKKPETFGQRFIVFAASAIITWLLSFAISFCVNESGLGWGENGRVLFAIPGGIFGAALVHVRGSWEVRWKGWLIILICAIFFGTAGFFTESKINRTLMVLLVFGPGTLNGMFEKYFEQKLHLTYFLALGSVASVLIPVFCLKKMHVLGQLDLLTVSYICWQLGFGAILSINNPLAQKENLRKQQEKLIDEIGKDE